MHYIADTISIHDFKLISSLFKLKSADLHFLFIYVIQHNKFEWRWEGSITKVELQKYRMEVVNHVVFTRSQRGINTDATWKDGPIQLQLTLQQIKKFVCENNGCKNMERSFLAENWN